MGDQDDRLPVGRVPLQGGEERRRLVRRENGRRLVEDEDRGIGGERPGDLDPLARPDRKLRHGRVGVAEVEVERLRETPDTAAAGPGRLDERGRGVEKREVLGDGGRFDEEVVLRDEGDPAAPRLARRPERDVPAGEPDRAAVGTKEARGDGNERRLAGAVLSEKGVDLAGQDRERGTREGPGLPEALRDPVKLEQRQKFPRGTVRAPEAISAFTRATSSMTAGGTEAFCVGLQTNEMTPEARP